MPALNTIEYAGSLTVNVGSTQASKLAIQVLLLGSLGSQLQNAVPWAINSFPLVCFEKCGPPDGVRHPTARRKRLGSGYLRVRCSSRDLDYRPSTMN
jgi:hypothetical protein